MASPPEPEAGPADVAAAHVGQQTRRGISWNLAASVVSNGLRIVVLAVLGRALTKTDFGIVAVAVSVNVVLSGIRDVGIGPALVQRKNLDHGHKTTAFAMSTYLGVAFTVGLLLFAPAIAGLYRIPDATDAIRGLAFLFLLRGVSTTSRMLCQRNMQFRAIATIETMAFMVGSILSVVLALLGFGPWALIVGYLAEELLSSGLYLVLSPPPVSLRVDRKHLGDLMSFGAGQTVAQIAGTLATYGDNFVVGRSLGDGALGLYTRAYELIKFPSMVFATIVGNVIFPAFSRMQDDPARMAASFRRGLFVNALVLLPASALLFVVAPEAIAILVGPNWDEAVLPFRILTVTILLRTSQKLGAIVTQSAGRVNAIAFAYIVYMVFVIGGAGFSVRYGIAGVATSTAIAIAVVCSESCYFAMRATGLKLSAVLRAHVPGLVLAALVLAVVFPLTALLRGQQLPAAIVFGGAALPALLVCLLVGVVWLRRGKHDFAWLADELGRVFKRGRRGRKTVKLP